MQKRKVVKLNLVSLMDVFTILVFFLLVNTSDVQQPSGNQLKLPKAKIAQPIANSLVIAANAAAITVQGRKVADVPEALASDEIVIAGLFAELQYQFDRGRLDDIALEERSATVMADRHIPFVLLHRIMATASRAGYGQVSLAVVGEPVDQG